MLHLAIYSLVIVVTFFCAGAFSGILFTKYSERADREGKLMWTFLFFLIMYFACGFCVQIIKHKGFSMALIQTITMQKVAPVSGLFLCLAILFALTILGAAYLERAAERQKSLIFCTLCSFVCGIILFLWKRVSLAGMVMGGDNFMILGILAFFIFYYAGFFCVYKKRKINPQNTLLEKENKLLEKIGAYAKRHPILCYVVCYTGTFLCLIVIVFSTMILSGKSLVWKIDAMPQYVPYIRYMGNYLRETISNMLHGNFNIKMYDFTIGMGEDIRSVVRTYPSNFLTVFVPTRYMELFYNFFMFFRFYLAGLAFTAYCRYRKNPWVPTFIAAYIYIFSGYVLNMGVRHPLFTIPMIYLPMLLIALDRLIKDRKVLMYSLFVGISLFTNYYFLYMNTVVMGVYALVRFAQIYKENRVKEFISMMIRIILSYLLGCCMGAASFLPTIVRTLNSDRIGASNAKVGTDNLFIYQIERPFKILAGLITGSYSPSYDTYLGMVILIVPVLVVFFLRKKNEKAGLKWIVLLEYIALSVPAFGFAMAGFSSINNRWTYIVAFTLAYVSVLVLDDLRELTKIQMIGLVVVTAFYYPILKFMPDDPFDAESTFRMLVGIVLVLLLINYMKKISTVQFYTVLLLCLTLSLAVHGRQLYDVDGMVNEFMYNGSITTKFERSSYNFLTKIPDDSFYRVDTSAADDEFENTGLVLGYHGVSMYNSVINKGIVKYHKDLASIGISAVHRIYSLDSRTALEALADTHYYMIRKDLTGNLPYGYSKYKNFSTKNNDYVLYKNNYPLSLGYTYDAYTDEEDYEKLSSIEKQQTMLESVVVDTKKADTTGLEDTNHAAEKIKYGKVALKSASNMVVKTDRVRAKEPDGQLTLSYKKKKGYEAYLMVKGATTKKPRIKIKITTKNLEKHLIVRDSTQTYALGRDSYLINLGYSNTSGKEDVTITFPIKGKVTYSDVKVCYVPMNDYVSQVKARNAESLQDVSMDTNKVSGNIKVSSDKIMVLSIPYSSGWKAYVDGKETKIFRANTMYMGIHLQKGSHTVQLKYTSPGLHLGMIVSAGGILLFVVLVVVSKKRRKEG